MSRISPPALPANSSSASVRRCANSSLADTIPRCVEQQALARGGATAVACDGETLTYVELNKRANQLAHYLQRAGIRPEEFVGIYMERSIETVIAILGVLKAGGAYLPIDLAYPRERLEFMLADSKAPVLLTQKQFADGFAGFGGKIICVDANAGNISLESAENPVVELLLG